MAAKPKLGRLVVNEGKAIYVLTRDPWYKVGKYIRLLPPWSKLRGGYREIVIREPMRKATEAFAKAASATKGMERWARREAIAKALRGKSYGGQKRTLARKVSVEEALAAIRAAGVPIEEALTAKRITGV